MCCVRIKVHNCIYGNTVFTQMQDKVSSLNLALDYVRLSLICEWTTELDHIEPDCSELDHAEPNHGLHHQIIMLDPCSTEILHSVE